MQQVQLLFSEVFLGISIILLIFMMAYLKKSNSRKTVVLLFNYIFALMLIWDSCLFLQYIFSPILNIDPIYFDYITYIGIMFLPVFLYLTAQTFSKPKFKIRNYHKLLFVVPIISLTILWTNDFHHLFYTNYSLFLVDSTFGPYFYIHTVYTYSLIIISLGILLKHSVKQTHKITAQTLLFLLAIAIPVLVNIVGTLDLIHLSIYATPISFTISVVLLFIAIFRFGFLNLNSIALQEITNTISDSYIVIDSEDIISSCNTAFLETFKLKAKDILNRNIFSINFDISNFSKDDLRIAMDLIQTKGSKITVEKHFEEIDKYFSIDFSPIIKNNSYIGTLIFLRDITEIEKDKIKLKSNQDLLVEQERLASLGQMIGGIAHNLKTPIFSISGGLEGLSDLTKEFDESIEDSSVTNEDMHDIAKDMNEWIGKLKGHISYMSEVITTVKGQAVNMSEEQNMLFTVNELFQHVNILMKHELNKKLATLKTVDSTVPEIKINGNINGLVQVINNLISNAIEAYSPETNEKKVELLAKYDDKNRNVIISVKDFGPGLPENVQEKLFKEMITTKGKNGTGLGLFMSYSNIKAHFNGDITFTTAKNKGTTFNIIIPIS